MSAWPKRPLMVKMSALKRNDHAGFRLLLVIAGRGRNTRSDLRTRSRDRWASSAMIGLGGTSCGLFADRWPSVIDVQVEDRVGDLGRKQRRPDDLARARVHLGERRRFGLPVFGRNSRDTVE